MIPRLHTMQVKKDSRWPDCTCVSSGKFYTRSNLVKSVISLLEIQVTVSSSIPDAVFQAANSLSRCLGRSEKQRDRLQSVHYVVNAVDIR